MRRYNKRLPKILCRRLCRAPRTASTVARRALSAPTRSRSVPHPLRSLRHTFCLISRDRGALTAIVTCSDMRQGSLGASAEPRWQQATAMHMGPQRRLSPPRRNAPVLLAHVFVVIGNAEHEPLAHTRATLSDSAAALVRKMARGEDTRRRSGNLSGPIFRIAYGERPGTKTGTRVQTANLSLSPSLEERAMGESLQKSLRIALLYGVSDSWRFRQGVAARCHASQ